MNRVAACGIADRAVTSLELESPCDPPPTFEQVLHSTARQCGRIFNRQVLHAGSLDELLGTADL